MEHIRKDAQGGFNIAIGITILATAFTTGHIGFFAWAGATIFVANGLRIWIKDAMKK